MKTSKVIIEVNSGIVTVYGTPDLVGKLEIVVLDHDDLSTDTDRPKRGYSWERIAEGEIKNKQVVELA